MMLPMITVDGIRALAAKIERELGLAPEKALEYANAIGDTPQKDKAGKIIIRNWDNEIIDRISISGY